ncbi:hypothetical protein [Ferrimonas pelagia]
MADQHPNPEEGTPAESHQPTWRDGAIGHQLVELLEGAAEQNGAES